MCTLEPIGFDCGRAAYGVGAGRMAGASGNQRDCHVRCDGAAHPPRITQRPLPGPPPVTGWRRSAIELQRWTAWRPRSRLTVRITTNCRDQTTRHLHTSAQRGDEGIVYFVGLTNGTTSVALYGVRPEADATSRSVDVSAPALGKIIRSAAEVDLQVVGQIHTHPGGAYHSEGDLAGMRIRYPGYFSIVVPDYGARLPSFRHSHTVMWTTGGFQEIDAPVRLVDVLRP